MVSTTNELSDLPSKALAGDTRATAQFKVNQWNSRTEVGARVAYLKSEAEGICVIRTASLAYVLGEDIPAIELEHVGTVMLDKIEIFYE